MYILTVSDMRAAEDEAFCRGILPLRLMENAGASFVKTLRDKINVEGKKIIVAVGNGNNGGDGYVIARKLKEYGAEVQIIKAFGGNMTDSASKMAAKAGEAGLRTIGFGLDREYAISLINQADIIIDALFGIGFSREADGFTAELFELISRSRAFVAAVDIPSGLFADSGEINSAAVRADLTIALGAYKFAHILPPASELCGEVVCCPIGLPDGSIKPTGTYCETIDKSDVALNLPKREKNSHKGSFGPALFVCGSYNMTGAAVLSVRAAIRSGAGLTKLVSPKSAYPLLAPSLIETVHIPLDETPCGTIAVQALPDIISAAKGAKAMCVGCGLGRNRSTDELICGLMNYIECPIILDADGINAIAQRIDIMEHREHPLIITPHPAEMARLWQTDAKTVNADRIGFAKRTAQRFGCTVVLKGANTVVATKSGRIFVNMNGNAGMATAGSGDMLSGIITALICQGLSPDSAAACGVYIHAAAGDIARDNFSEISMTVSDMIDSLPSVFKFL